MKIEASKSAEIRELRYKYNDAELGLITGIALLLLLGAWSWFKNIDVLQVPQRFNVLFHNTAGLTENANVFVDGVRVGAVEKIQILAKHKVLVGVKIHTDKIVIPEGSQVSILMNGLVGARYVEVELPDHVEGKPVPLTSDMCLIGTDPVRAELIVNKLALELDHMNFAALNESLQHGMRRMGEAADSMHVLSKKLQPVADRALVMEDRVTRLATDLNHTTCKVNEMIDNPNFSSDIKSASANLRSTSERLQQAVSDIKSTLADKSMRQDVQNTVSQLNETAGRLENTMTEFSKLSRNDQLRDDAKEIIGKADDTVTKLNNLMKEPNFASNIDSTLSSTRTAISDFDTVAKQMQNILDQKHPLMHMIFGRPGSRTAAKPVATPQ